MNELLSEPFERLLADASPPDVVRQIEHGGSAAPLWARIEASGFLDTLVPEAAGGAGLSLAEAFPLFLAEGRHALPVPLAHTMTVRAALAAEGLTAPPGMIAIAPLTRSTAEGAVFCPGTPYGTIVDWILAATTEGWMLLAVADAERHVIGIHGSLRADLRWSRQPAGARASQHLLPWQEAGAAIAAAHLAGAMERALQLTVAYANERVQFGRSIGKFQAIQHQIAVMAEHVFAAHMAAELGFVAAEPLPQKLRVAVAKARASEAAALVTSIAHAVHGAIGVTSEFDLQIYTRRIHEWRADFGSEQYWNRILGRALLTSDAGSALDFMRAELVPPQEKTK